MLLRALVLQRALRAQHSHYEMHLGQTGLPQRLRPEMQPLHYSLNNQATNKEHCANIAVESTVV
jgi:hypothetical protein